MVIFSPFKKGRQTFGFHVCFPAHEALGKGVYHEMKTFVHQGSKSFLFEYIPVDKRSRARVELLKSNFGRVAFPVWIFISLDTKRVRKLSVSVDANGQV